LDAIAPGKFPNRPGTANPIEKAIGKRFSGKLQSLRIFENLSGISGERCHATMRHLSRLRRTPELAGQAPGQGQKAAVSEVQNE
jgi:hypothetical protein